MPRYTHKESGVTIDIGDDDTLPGVDSDWNTDGGPTRRRRRADTGAVPVQDGR